MVAYVIKSIKVLTTGLLEKETFEMIKRDKMSQQTMPEWHSKSIFVSIETAANRVSSLLHIMLPRLKYGKNHSNNNKYNITIYKAP